MELHSIFFVVLIILQTGKADIPGCDFLETVNISSQAVHNGSYIYQDLEIPANLSAEYDYTTTELGLNNRVKSHLRACVCQLKPCIWICCRYKDMQPNGECTDGLMEELRGINPFLNVTLSNGSVVKRNLREDFIVLRDPMRLGDLWVEDEYTLFENGSILLRSEMNETLVFRGYDCLHPNYFNSGNTESAVVAFHYGINNVEPLPAGANELIWVTEVFLILTTAVYLYVKKLRNLHGKCFICYMITSFIFLWLKIVQVPTELCALRGYCYYFFVMAKFTWLFSLSLQMWKGFTSVNRAECQHSFRAYSIFAWGTAAILTGVIYLIDQIWGGEANKVEWIPAVGWQNCDIKKGWSFYAYINGPFVTLVALNTTLFVLTIISYIRVRLSLKYAVDHEERARNLSSRMETYQMFLRLIIIMDIQWSVRIVGLLLNWEGLLDTCTYGDYCIGIIIFVLFVLKRRTIQLLMESFRNRSILHS